MVTTKVKLCKDGYLEVTLHVIRITTKTAQLTLSGTNFSFRFLSWRYQAKPSLEGCHFFGSTH